MRLEDFDFTWILVRACANIPWLTGPNSKFSAVFEIVKNKQKLRSVFSCRWEKNYETNQHFWNPLPLLANLYLSHRRKFPLLWASLALKGVLFICFRLYSPIWLGNWSIWAFTYTCLHVTTVWIEINGYSASTLRGEATLCKQETFRIFLASDMG